MRSRLERLPRRELYTVVCGLLVVIALFVVPTWPPHTIGGASDYLVSVAGLAVIWGIVAVGTALFVNLTGLPTLAHAGLWGVGAYSSGIAIVHLGVGFWPSLAFAAAVPALVALPVGLISLRTTGVAFLVVTIAFTEFIVLVITNASFTEGSAGLVVTKTPGSIGPIDLNGPQGQYYLFLFFLFATLAVCRWVSRSRFGARLRAIRDDERLARSVGFNVLWHQLLAFELTAVIVGIAGALLLTQQQAVTPDLFNALQFIPIYLAIMVGGIAVLAGGALGAWIAQFLPLWIGSDNANLSLLIYGAVLVAAMLFLPKGILGTLQSWVARDPRRAAPQVPAAAPAQVAPPTAPPRPTRELDGAVVLEVAGAQRWFGANRALDGVDLSVTAGEIRGVIGPNGSGKTTLLNCASGFLSLTGGAISYRGDRIDGRAPDQIARLGLVRTFQEPEVFASFTSREICELVASSARAREGANELLPDSADAVLASCGLHAVADSPVTELSYGQLRLLGVAAAISCRPFVLLLDEPAAGLTPADSAALREVILDAREHGVTVVVVDHDMSFLLPICDRLTVLDGGTKLAEGAPDEIARHPAVIAAYLGESFARRHAEAQLGESAGA
ncbi:MAG: branched-chain amino acid transport system ATP-binding protein livM [Thermoleophilaceae bacterium]|nr:branched-chain amino acid transport system ATP-binding protein livM [Thermoleophilaceae bacterium]